MYKILRRVLALSLLCVLSAACASPASSTISAPSPAATKVQATPPTSFPAAPYPTTVASDRCPANLSFVASCQTPLSMRIAYGVEPLIQRGYTGKGQTVVDIVSFGSPTLQRDIDVFDHQFGLPPITVKQISPLNEAASDPRGDRPGWGDETTLDVEIIHALAPDAGIVVLVSPVAETEGTAGLPEFRQLLQYAIDHKLGTIVSQSWGASEATLADPAGQAEIRTWDALFQQATTRDGMTLLASSGDNGATDFTDLQGSRLSSTATSSFPNDDPWVTSVGGTSLHRSGNAFGESAWSGSGGGMSKFFARPAYQQTLPAGVQSLLQNRRGLPDVAADADP
ncbi:MAG TPA: S53 family peptidase, partial [Ktedonobacteraceae bacterium]